MVVFGFQEATAVAALGAFVFVQLSDTMMKSTGRRMRYYKVHKPSWAPPGIAFPIVWTILYCALTLGAFYFLQNTVPDSWQYIVGFIMFMIHVIANKLWSITFWNLQNPTAALGIIVGVLIPTALVWLIVSIVNQVGLYYVNVITLAIMLCWLVYAAALNGYYTRVTPLKNQV